MEIRAAKKNEYDAVVNYYKELIATLGEYDFQPRWVLGVHPSYELIKSSIENDDMILALEDDKIIGAMVLNQLGNDGYKEINWKVSASENEIAYIHILAVDSKHLHKKIASQMVQFAIERCKARSLKVIRLDVIDGNAPAGKLYEACGFDLVEVKQIYYPDCGWQNFTMFEYNLEK